MAILKDLELSMMFAPPKNWETANGDIIEHKPYRKYLRTDLRAIFESKGVVDPHCEDREIVAQVFPFKINQHIVDIIDWSNYESDPIFQLTFPQPDMLPREEIELIKARKESGATREEIAELISEIRSAKNPAPANQASNRPLLEDDHDDSTIALDGLQHKYDQIVLMFHKNAQTCHAYCTYCFRFNQFVGKDKFLESDEKRFHKYLAQHKEVSDILLTGGDPSTMKAHVFKEVLEPLLAPEFDHITTIRIGTKALTYHPYRFLTEPDADELIALFRKMKDNGKHIAIMAHFSHYNELTPDTLEAAKRLREEAGCVIRTQAPIMKYINDDPEVWAKMWQIQIANGLIPYYMFIARDTGPQQYFEVPLAKALAIYQEARKRVSGLSHTARGPSMSAGPGKICILGRETVAGEDVFIMKFLQGRNSDWCDRVFFAKYDENATWLHHLKPAFGEKEFFFEEEYRQIIAEKRVQHQNAGV
jgi:KamA family protein